jgi:uncharacterized protein YhdP
VAAQIDHFTENMSASGKGRLDIALVIPLEEARLGDSRIEGTYTFLANEVTVDPGAAAAAAGQGQPAVLGEGSARTGDQRQLFGGPVRIKGARRAARCWCLPTVRWASTTCGDASEMPLLDNLSGTTTYRAEVRVQKRDVELVLDSNLVGVASTLPAPLGKNAGEAMPLHFESSLLPTAAAAWRPGDRSRPVARHPRQCIQHASDPAQAGKGRLSRTWCDHDWSAACAIAGTWHHSRHHRQERSNARLLAENARQRARKGALAAADVPVSVDLKADEVVLLGGSYTGVSVGASGATSLWRGTVQSDQAVGSFLWDGSGAGKLKAQFRKWRRPEAR